MEIQNCLCFAWLDVENRKSFAKVLICIQQLGVKVLFPYDKNAIYFKDVGCGKNEGENTIVLWDAGQAVEPEKCFGSCWHSVAGLSAYGPEYDARGIGEATHQWFSPATWLADDLRRRGRIRQDVSSLTRARQRPNMATASHPRIKKGDNTYEMRNIRERNCLIHPPL